MVNGPGETSRFTLPQSWTFPEHLKPHHLCVRLVIVRNVDEGDPVATPNLFLIYVTDVQRSTGFYSDLFEMEPVMVTPRYVPFEVAPGVLFALWSGAGDAVTATTPRSSEVGLMLPGSSDAVDHCYAKWMAKGVNVVDEPRDEVFGRTFVVADPDGNLIRVSPLD